MHSCNSFLKRTQHTALLTASVQTRTEKLKTRCKQSKEKEVKHKPFLLSRLPAVYEVLKNCQFLLKIYYRYFPFPFDFKQGIVGTILAQKLRKECMKYFFTNVLTAAILNAKRGIPLGRSRRIVNFAVAHGNLILILILIVILISISGEIGREQHRIRIHGRE